MSKFVRVNDTDYKLTVNSGGTITLNTGVQAGTVIVTGDLLVRGNTTTVESETMAVRDNIIIINDGETGSGITLTRAGIQIDRGIASDAQIFFDESLSFLDTQIGSTTSGLYIFKKADGNLVGLRTNSITTGGYDLNLIGSGTAVINVAGTTDYENQVTDDDDIPNRKWTEDYITSYLATFPPFKIGEFNSELEINDSADTGTTNLTLRLDGIESAVWTEDLHSVQGILIKDTRIESTISNTDLVLASPGTGSVAVDDNLKLRIVLTDPVYSTDGVKLFGKAEAEGGTGVYFVNTKNTTDELVSRRKALAYSMIF